MPPVRRVRHEHIVCNKAGVRIVRIRVRVEPFALVEGRGNPAAFKRGDRLCISLAFSHIEKV